MGIDEPNPSEKLDVNGRIVAKGYKNTVYSAGGLSASSITLISNNTWADMPDLSVTFSLEAATTVMSSYTISTIPNPSMGQAFLVTRILIDGTEVNRMVSGFVNGGQGFFNSSGQYVSELAAGDHTIKVQYRTNASLQINPASSDFMNRFLQVLVFGAN